MKKLLAMLMVLAMMLAMIACNNGNSDNTDGTGTKKPTSSTPVTEGDTSEADTSKAPEAEPDYLQFAVSEGDYGDMFRNEGKWTGDRTTANQVMTVTGSSDTESVVEWKGVAAGKSFEYEVKLRVDSFGGAYVSVIFDTETHTVNLKITESELVILKDGGEEKVTHTTDSDWHIYRFNVVDNSCKLWVDGSLIATVALPARTGTECRLAFATTKATFGANYVKVKTTEEGWVKPEDRPPVMTEITDWLYVEEFDGSISDLTNNGWRITEADGKTQTIANGKLLLTNSTSTEDVIFINDSKFTMSSSFALEVKVKADFPTGNCRLSVISWFNNNFRIHSQIKDVSFNLQGGSGWNPNTVENSDDEFHVYRYECTIADGVSKCSLFFDGNFVGSYEMNANNRENPEVRLVTRGGNEGEEMTAEFEYIKFTELK